MMPLVHSVACLNGRFNYSSDCFGETWQKAGTPAAPTGAIACYASPRTIMGPPCDGQTGAVDLMVAETYHSIAGLLINGCMYGMDLWPGTEADQLYQQWHIFGDASTMLFTDTPTAMTVTHSGAFPSARPPTESRLQGLKERFAPFTTPRTMSPTATPTPTRRASRR